MKKFRRILGIILMAFNGLGVVSIIGSLGSFIKDDGFGIWILLLLVFGALCLLVLSMFTLSAGAYNPFIYFRF